MADLFFDASSEKHFEELARYVSEGNVTAFVGAGLSAAAGMPSWQGLYKRFCDHIRGPGHPESADFTARGAPDAFLRYRDAFPSVDDYLAFLKGIFCRPIPVVPEAYQILPEIFKTIATTNYDPLLESAARDYESGLDDKLVYYPYPYNGERYVYLHGHAGYATGKNDLVLCTDDYDLQTVSKPLTGYNRGHERHH